MVLEQLISTTWLQRRPYTAFVLGLVYTIIGSITGYLFFRDYLSISILFLITLLLLPSLMNLLTVGEEREKKEGFHRFIFNHLDIFEVYLFLSLGVFFGYLLMILVLGFFGSNFNTVVGEQLGVLGNAITTQQIQDFHADRLAHALGIFFKNVGVATIFFVLSFFYGAGSIFLIVWNASIFSTFVSVTLRNISQGVNHNFALLGAFSLYIIPEISGFLLAAIAGGVVSKAVVVEQFLEAPFRNVVRDAFLLLLYSLLILLIAAFLEAYVGVGLIKALV